MKNIFTIICFLTLSFISISADEQTLDGSSVDAFKKSLSQMSSSLNKEEEAQFLGAFFKLANTLDLGPMDSQEDARQRMLEAMSTLLNGKTFAEIIAMVSELPDNPDTLKILDEFKKTGTSDDYQHDADIVRLKHLKYLGNIIEEFKEVNGHYPLQTGSTMQNYVLLAGPQQQQYAQGGPMYEHTNTDVSEFKAILEKGLGRSISLPYDPQLVPANKPNYYIYMTEGDRYNLAVHLHDGDGIGRKIGPYHYKIEISNDPNPSLMIFNYKQLMSSEAFTKRINDRYRMKPPVNPDQDDLDLEEL